MLDIVACGSWKPHTRPPNSRTTYDDEHYFPLICSDSLISTNRVVFGLASSKRNYWAGIYRKFASWMEKDNFLMFFSCSFLTSTVVSQEIVWEDFRGVSLFFLFVSLKYLTRLFSGLIMTIPYVICVHVECWETKKMMMR
ncbi:hypothetical protein F4809DRAFT_273415 [Biscogniauxia mediterranea]|nr:hypothetical protein F4809DRAFT_273415 [Biscogniauxia mediterranea]